MEFCKMVREAREVRFSSAREFFSQVKPQLSISYYYYSKIEQDTLPKIEIVNELIRALGMNQRSALYAWVRDTMPTVETKAIFTEIGTPETRSSEQVVVHRSVVINRMQAKLMESNPVYWEIALYLACHHNVRNFSETELGTAFAMPLTKIKPLINKLYEYGIIERNSKGRFMSKEWLFIPYEDEFENLRNLNFKRAFDRYMLQDQGPKFRTTLTRLLTPSMVKQVESMVHAIVNSIIDLPENIAPPEAQPYTIGVFASKRTFGHD